MKQGSSSQKTKSKPHIAEKINKDAQTEFSTSNQIQRLMHVKAKNIQMIQHLLQHLHSSTIAASFQEIFLLSAHFKQKDLEDHVKAFYFRKVYSKIMFDFSKYLIFFKYIQEKKKILKKIIIHLQCQQLVIDFDEYLTSESKNARLIQEETQKLMKIIPIKSENQMEKVSNCGESGSIKMQS